MCEVCLMVEMLSTLWQYEHCITGCMLQSLNDIRCVSANNGHSGTVLWGFLPFALFYMTCKEK